VTPDVARTLEPLPALGYVVPEVAESCVEPASTPIRQPVMSQAA